MCFQTKVDFPPCGHSIDTFVELCGEAWRRPNHEPCADPPQDCIQVYHHQCWECDPSHESSDKAELAQREQDKIKQLEARDAARQRLMGNMRTIERQGHQAALDQAHSSGPEDVSAEDAVASPNMPANGSPTSPYTQPLRSVTFNDQVEVHPAPEFSTGSTATEEPVSVENQPETNDEPSSNSQPENPAAPTNAEHEPNPQEELAAVLAASRQAHLENLRAQAERNKAEEEEQLRAAMEASVKDHEDHQILQRSRSDEAQAAEDEALQKVLEESAQTHLQHQRSSVNTMSDEDFERFLKQSAAEHRASHHLMSDDDEEFQRILRESAEHEQRRQAAGYDTEDDEDFQRALEASHQAQYDDPVSDLFQHGVEGPSHWGGHEYVPDTAALREARIAALSPRGHGSTDEQPQDLPTLGDEPDPAMPPIYMTMPPPGSTRPLPPPAPSVETIAETGGLPPMYATTDNSTPAGRGNEPWWEDQSAEQEARGRGKGKGKAPERGG